MNKRQHILTLMCTEYDNRINISLGNEQMKSVENLANKYGVSKSEIFRKAVDCFKMVEGKKDIPLEVFGNYSTALSKGECIVLDIECLDAIFEETENFSEAFWKKCKKIGQRHWLECKDIGLTQVDEILYYIEHQNWIRVNKISENRFVLILKSRKMRKFVLEFIRGLFRKSPYEVDIEEASSRKIFLKA